MILGTEKKKEKKERDDFFFFVIIINNTTSSYHIIPYHHFIHTHNTTYRKKYSIIIIERHILIYNQHLHIFCLLIIITHDSPQKVVVLAKRTERVITLHHFPVCPTFRTSLVTTSKNCRIFVKLFETYRTIFLTR
jgi:hypothetical protein